MNDNSQNLGQGQETPKRGQVRAQERFERQANALRQNLKKRNKQRSSAKNIQKKKTTSISN
ncbi:MAG: hypothetical protein CL568_03850 [Alphaproteobacteria bacterium]|jgi:hypothetical protein|nr:hypothetical protein [Alphaproteobacteria bacterium]|tara:strand:- start:6485 stop:6667 length:183 start_codon:yes stop_codon:yes gene_type:complete